MRIARSHVAGLIIVWLMASTVSAKLGFQSNGAATVQVSPGEVIKVDLYSSEPVQHLTLENIVETPTVGGIASNLWLHEGFTWRLSRNLGKIINSEGVLISNVAGIADIDSSAVSGVIYSFDYKVGNAESGSTFTIGPGEGANEADGIVPTPLVVLVSCGTTPVTALEITGPDEVPRNSSVQYGLTAFFADGSLTNLRDPVTWWCEPVGFASMSSNGVLTVQYTEVPVDVTIHAGHYRCNLMTAEKSVKVLPVVTYYVSADSGSDSNNGLSEETAFATIQRAIDEAQDGQRVIVLPGRYTGQGNRNIDFGGKAITVGGINPTDSNIVSATVVDCEGQGSGFHFDSVETELSVLEGLTIINGKSGEGGGVWCYNASPTIRNCVLSNNKASSESGLGGAIAAVGESNLTVRNCIIRENRAQGKGGGIFSQEGRLTIAGCTVTGNKLLSGAPDDIFANSSEVNLGGLGENTVVDVAGVTGNGSMVSGMGSLTVRGGGQMSIGGDTQVDLSNHNYVGKIECNGLLKIKGSAVIRNTRMVVNRAVLEEGAALLDNTISIGGGFPYGQIFAKDNATLMGNRMESNGDRYLQLVPAAFGGVIANNDIYVRVTEGSNGTAGGLYELRGRDMFCMADCEPGIYQVEAAPISGMDSWTIERLELVEGANLTLTNRDDYQPPYDQDGENEVLYVRELILGPNSILDTAFNRVYYETLVRADSAQVVNNPLLGFSLDGLTLDDEDEFNDRVKNSNFTHPSDPNLTRIHVEYVKGSGPDPNGMIEMHILPDLDPDSPTYQQLIGARLMGLFASSDEETVLIRFHYLFNTVDPSVQLVVYLVDVPEMLAHDDPDRPEHYLEVGRVPAPPPPKPGSLGSDRFGVFQKVVSAGHLDFSNGLRVELELIQVQSTGQLTVYRGVGQSIGGEGAIVMSSSNGSGVIIDDLDVQVHCDGICMDITWDDFVNEVDFLTVITQCGVGAGLNPDGTGSRSCLEGAFSNDGYVDSYDIVSWDWALNMEGRKSLCNVLPLSENTSAASMALTQSMEMKPSASVPIPLAELLITGKRTATDAATKMKDHLYLFDSDGVYVNRFAPTSERSNIRLVRSATGELYQVNADAGVVRLDETDEVVIPAGELDGMIEPRYGEWATVYVGVHGEGSDSTGRPVLDVVVDRGYAYVVPVVVSPSDSEPYTAAAKLNLLTDGDPPYELVQIYDDPPPPGDNQYQNSLREIELDDSGNLYVINAHDLNESDILWRYFPDGTIERVDLGRPGSANYLPAPTGMCVSSSTDMLYLASSQYNPADATSSVIYGFSTGGSLTLERVVTVGGMHHITGITEDPQTGTLWVTGFSMDEIPQYPNPTKAAFYEPYLASVPLESSDVQASYIGNSGSSDNDLAMPLSIVWTVTPAPCGGADLNQSGSVSFEDFALLAQYWLAPNCTALPECVSVDISLDGSIDYMDVAVLAQQWLQGDCTEE